MGKSIKLTVDGQLFTASLNENQTVEDILKMLPLDLTLQRYSGHEYYSSLPKKPSTKDVPMTSNAHAGGIYYYEGWNAFTLLFGDAYIAPYKVVHIGEVTNDIVSFLANAGNEIEVNIEVTN